MNRTRVCTRVVLVFILVSVDDFGRRLVEMFVPQLQLMLCSNQMVADSRCEADPNH